MKRCLNCGKELLDSKTSTCSLECATAIKKILRDEERNAKIELGYKTGKNGPNGESYLKECVICNSKFWAFRLREKTCSKQCSKKLMRNKKLQTFIDKACDMCEHKQLNNEGVQVCSFDSESVTCSKFCLYCGKPITFNYQLRKRKFYCNQICARRYVVKNSKPKPKIEKKIFELICPVCNSTFKTKKKNQKYCSNKCSLDSINTPKKEKILKDIELGNRGDLRRKFKCICETCGKEFFSEIKDGKYCCKEHVHTVDKLVKTTIEKYGDIASRLEFVKEKKKQTNLKKYGSTSYTNSELRKERIAQGLELAGRQKDISHFERYHDVDFISTTFTENGFFDLEAFMAYFNIQSDSAARVKKESLGIKTPNKTNSFVNENRIYDFIRSFYQGVILLRDRNILKPLELDIYLPDEKLAIEFDGLLFHSYGKHKDGKFNFTKEFPKRHLDKTQKCEELGINLLHIFENEWYRNPVSEDIWKSMIKHKLGFNDKSIPANKCSIISVDKNVAKYFLDTNHIQGAVPSSVELGLMSADNELVAVMTLGKPRFNKEYEYELLRFSIKKYYHVTGAFNKLYKYFKENVYNGKVISYGNRRWTSSLNNIYSNNATFLRATYPNYYYFKSSNIYKLYSRVQFQKHKLKEQLEIFDENLSETENMYNNGYRKIFDCGNLVYELN